MTCMSYPVTGDSPVYSVESVESTFDASLPNMVYIEYESLEGIFTDEKRMMELLSWFRWQF